MLELRKKRTIAHYDSCFPGDWPEPGRNQFAGRKTHGAFKRNHLVRSHGLNCPIFFFLKFELKFAEVRAAFGLSITGRSANLLQRVWI